MGNQSTKKSARSKFTKKSHNNEDFIINHSQHNTKNDITDIKSFDERRKVFISLLGLFQSWQNCPTNVLYSALFILPLKSKWIYSPHKHLTELQKCRILQSSVFSNSATKKFIQMLKWKDSQKLIIWMLDDYLSVNEKNDQIIHPIWYYISDKFDELKLNKLTLNTNWWKNQAVATGSYEPKTHEILSEFYFRHMKFKTMKKIISQSNPNSLHVIEYYTSNVYETERKYTLCELNNNANTDDIYNNWWLSSDYNQENHDCANMLFN